MKKIVNESHVGWPGAYQGQAVISPNLTTLRNRLRPWVHRRCSLVSIWIADKPLPTWIVGSGFYYQYDDDLYLLVTCAHVLKPMFDGREAGHDYEVALMDGSNNGDFFKPTHALIPSSDDADHDVGILVLNKDDVTAIRKSRTFLLQTDVFQSQITHKRTCAFKGYPSAAYGANHGKYTAKGWFELTDAYPSGKNRLRIPTKTSAQLLYAPTGLFGVSGGPVFETADRKLIGQLRAGHRPHSTKPQTDLFATSAPQVLSVVDDLVLYHRQRAGNTYKEIPCS